MESSQTSVHTFGPEYEQLLLRLHEALKRAPEFALQFPDPTAAHRMQARVRSYIRALKRDGNRPDLIGLCADVSSRLAGSAIVFYRAANAPDAIMLRHALGLSPGFADGSDTRGVIAPSTHLDTLKRIRERK